MANNRTTTIERIIAKLDNDFNPDNSDWIPRVSAWVYDALNQLKCLRKQYKCRRLEVHNRIAISPCCPDDSVRVFDKYGCEIKMMNDARCGSNCDEGRCSPSSTGGLNLGCEEHDEHHHYCGCDPCHPHHHEHFDDCGFKIDVPHPHDCCHVAESHTRECVNTHLFPDKVLNWTEHTGSYDYRCMHRVHSVHIRPIDSYGRNRNFVVSGNNIELNFDTDYIVVAILQVETEYSEYFGTEVPKIPDNGLLIEAIADYCCYRMLTRGYKHPVMNLTSASEALNPYVRWKVNLEKVRRSVALDMQLPTDDDLMRSAFYLFTFNPR